MGVQPPVTSSSSSRDGLPWWREPFMWLVFGGPALVVVACIVTFVIAHNSSDQLVAKDLPDGHTGVSAMTPANQARNHAFTPAAPGDHSNSNAQPAHAVKP